MPRRKPISTLRSNRSFRRPAGQKPPRSITLILCEGETEREYFEAARIHYKLTTAEIVLAENTVGSAPISVVKCAEDKCAERGGYDKVFCVFDRDGHESFQRARDRIRTLTSRKRFLSPIEEAISVPCFEFWVLLHFERTDRQFDHCSVVVDWIRDQHVPGYAKADAAIARKLIVRVQDALTHADWLEGRAENNNYDPYTSIHHVLRHFAQVAN